MIAGGLILMEGSVFNVAEATIFFILGLLVLLPYIS